MKYTKYIHVLHLLSTVPAPVMQDTGAGGRRLVSPVSADDAIAAWDHLFTYIHAHWAKPMSVISTGEFVSEPRHRSSVIIQEFAECRA